MMYHNTTWGIKELFVILFMEIKKKDGYYSYMLQKISLENKAERNQIYAVFEFFF